MAVFGYSHRKTLGETVDRANEILKDQPKYVPAEKARAKRYEPRPKKPAAAPEAGAEAEEAEAPTATS